MYIQQHITDIVKYPFESCIGSRVRSISRKIDGIYRKHLGGTGITENQLSIMMALYKTGKIEQNQIGKFLNLEKSSLSRNLRRLIQAIYITKTGAVNHPSIELTASGKKLVEHLTPKWEAAMNEIHDALNESDIRAFNQFENRIRNM